VLTCPNALFGHKVLGRSPSKKTDQFFLVSGRYFSSKWGSEEFRKWCESELIERGYFSSIEEMPQLANFPKIINQVGFQPEFRYHFSFAKTRW
jgi:hypothetical protein